MSLTASWTGTSSDPGRLLADVAGADAGRPTTSLAWHEPIPTRCRPDHPAIRLGPVRLAAQQHTVTTNEEFNVGVTASDSAEWMNDEAMNEEVGVTVSAGSLKVGVTASAGLVQEPQSRSNFKEGFFHMIFAIRFTELPKPCGLHLLLLA